jgi:nitrate/nitrite transport system ATP-binding protein
MALVSLRGVGKGYGPGRPVLRDVNLELEEGELVAVLGESGAGKTTLLSMIAGLLAPDEGEILIDGRPVSGPGPDRSVVFQSYALLPWLTAYENVLLAVDRALGDASPEAKHARAVQQLETVGLGAALHKRPHELSGGMRQRVAVARALATSPKLLLLDEPFGALDALTRARLQGELERLFRADRKTVLLITNDLDEALLLADRIVPLGGGPAATLGPATHVHLPRPRDRARLHEDPRFCEARADLLAFLLGPGRRSSGVPRAAGRPPLSLLRGAA